DGDPAHGTGSRAPRRGHPGARRGPCTAPSLAVAQPRRRLQDLPAALPLPHDRPAARAQEPRRRPRHAGALGPRTALRPPAGPAHRRGGPGAAGAGLGGPAGRARRRRAVRHGPGRRRRDRRERPRVGGGVAGVGREAGREVLHAGGPDPHPARRPRGAGRGHAARRAAAARLRRPAGRGAQRRTAGRGLQDRSGAARGLRGQGAVPDEVLRAGAVAHPRRGGRPAQAPVPQGRRRADLHARRGRADPLRAHPAGDLGRDRARSGHRRLPGEQDPALWVVRPPGPLPSLGWYSPALPRGSGGGRRLADASPGGRPRL
ncbi:MAG: RecB family exonuclease, partial [uncultured Blastococcus sp.]